MEHSYRFRIYPTKEQTIQIQRTFGCCRFVYNYYLAKRIDAYKSDKTTLGYKACSADMTALKKQLPWLCEVDATALQSSLRALDAAYQNFFRRVKHGEKPQLPKQMRWHQHQGVGRCSAAPQTRRSKVPFQPQGGGPSALCYCVTGSQRQILCFSLLYRRGHQAAAKDWSRCRHRPRHQGLGYHIGWREV